MSCFLKNPSGLHLQVRKTMLFRRQNEEVRVQERQKEKEKKKKKG